MKISFYYRDNSKFLDTTIYYVKNKTLICRTITNQNKHFILLITIVIKILLRDLLLIIDHQIVCKNIIKIISFIEISFGGAIEI